MDMIKAQNVSYKYIRRDEEDRIVEEITALNNIDLHIPKGQFVAVIGHNGSGKSTFAKHINALLLPFDGKVFVDGMDTSDETVLWDIRKKAGMVFQNPDNQIIASVVEEDVAFGPENIGIEPEKIRERVAEALKIVGMEKYAKHSPARLSGGQKQRVAIAGALAILPQCLVFDESTAMLDPVGRREVMNVAKKLNKEEKITVIFITHYMEEAAMADRVVVMDRGKIVMDAAPAEVFADSEKLSALGLELPQAAQLAQELRQAGLPLCADIIDTETLVEAICELEKK